MDPGWRLVVAYLGVTKFELELVLAPDQYLMSKWGLKAPIPRFLGSFPLVCDELGLNLEYQQKHCENSILFNHTKKNALLFQKRC